MELARKKKQALDDLFNSGKISASTYESIDNELAAIISDIEIRQKNLANNLTAKIDDLENQISTLEIFLANSEIQYVAGEIDEELHAHESSAFSNGLSALRKQLEFIKEAVADLMPEVTEPTPPPTTIDAEIPQLTEEVLEETAEISVEAAVEEPVEVPAEVAVEVPVEAVIEVPAEAPVEEPVEIAVEETLVAPVVAPVEVPAEVPVEEPVEAAVEEPIEVHVEVPEVPVEAPVEVVVEEVAEETLEVEPIFDTRRDSAIARPELRRVESVEVKRDTTRCFIRGPNKGSDNINLSRKYAPRWVLKKRLRPKTIPNTAPITTNTHQLVST